MKRIADYRRLAAECRDLATKMAPQHRAQLIDMAKMWDDMAVEREQFVGEYPEFEIKE